MLPLQWTGQGLRLSGDEELESCLVSLDYLRTWEEREEARHLMNREIEAGMSWPFDKRFSPLKSHTCSSLPKSLYSKVDF